jgi:hypothetical protein
MPVRSFSRWDRAVIALAAAICAAAVAVLLQSEHPLASGPAFSSRSPAAGDAPAPTGPGLAVAARTTAVRAAADNTAKVTSVVRAGVLLPYGRSSGRFVNVMTPCENRGWCALAICTSIPAR